MINSKEKKKKEKKKMKIIPKNIILLIKLF